MGSVMHSIDVEVPVQTAYNQWTQFEEFPEFMEGVERVEQIDDRHLRWNVDIAGVEREFETVITEQRPDERVAWKSISGPDQAGVVTFHRLADEQTRVTLQMEFEPEGVVETIGDMVGAVSGRARGDLDRFKEFIEDHGVETGAWRGEIPASKGPDPIGTEGHPAAEFIDPDAHHVVADRDSIQGGTPDVNEAALSAGEFAEGYPHNESLDGYPEVDPTLAYPNDEEDRRTGS